MLLTFQAASWTTIAPALLANLAAGIFILPFFLFSATAGRLPTKYDKARLTRLVKVLEVAIMLVALAGFVLHSLAVLLGGAVPAGLAIRPCSGRSNTPCCPSISTKTSWWAATRWSKPAPSWRSCSARWPAAARSRRTRRICGGSPPPAWWWPRPATSRAGGAAGPAPDPPSRSIPTRSPKPGATSASPGRIQPVFLAILGISWFWLYGALFLAQFPAYAKGVLGGNEGHGDPAARHLHGGHRHRLAAVREALGGHIEIGLVPFGSIGLTIFGLELAFASPTVLPVGAPLAVAEVLAQPGVVRVLLFALLMLGFRRLFIVPLYAMMQSRSAAAHRARVIAANNILNALFMVARRPGAGGLLGAGLSIPALFGVAAVMNAAVAVYIYRLVPEFLLRFIVWMLIHTVYRLRTRGLEHIPEDGPAVLVQPREFRRRAGDLRRLPAADPLRDGPPDLPLAGAVVCVPPQPRHPHCARQGGRGDDGGGLRRSLPALAAGELVGLFPEGRITSTARSRRSGRASRASWKATRCRSFPGAARDVGQHVLAQGRPALSRPCGAACSAGSSCRRPRPAARAHLPAGLQPRWPSCGATGNKRRFSPG